VAVLRLVEFMLWKSYTPRPLSIRPEKDCMELK